MEKLLRIIAFVSVIWVNVQCLQQPERENLCRTPNNDIGVCISIQNCSIFANAVSQRKIETYDFIRDSQCGSGDTSLEPPNVCCGQYDNYFQEVTTAKPTKPIRRLIPSSSNLFPKNCGIQDGPKDVPLIVGGTATSFAEFPWLARLKHRKKNGDVNYGCSGFLISEQFVLTAAHCVRSEKLSPFGPVYQVEVGEYYLRNDPDCTVVVSIEPPENCAESPQLLETAEPIVHPNYTNDNNHYNDIAIIPLKDHAKFTDSVRPICLTTAHAETSTLMVAGWGKTLTSERSSVKLKVSVPRVDQENCRNLFSSVKVTIADSQLCAGGELDRDSCSGDSGGPLMAGQNESGDRKWYAEGIVSFGRGCGVKDWPGVYTSIPYFMPWIEESMNAYLSTPPRNSNNESESFCTTPNAEKGNCVSIHHCPILLNLVLHIDPFDRETVRFLQQSQCGYDQHPYVCCGTLDGYQRT